MSSNFAEYKLSLQLQILNDDAHLALHLMNWSCWGHHMQADICHLGMDQRKVSVRAREYCTAIKLKNKPIILSHRILVSSISCWIMFKFYVI